MITRLYPSKSEDTPHWLSFTDYCSNLLNLRPHKCFIIAELVEMFDKILKEYNGKIEWPSQDTESSWILNSVEFETEEDLVIFKLKFN